MLFFLEAKYSLFVFVKQVLYFVRMHILGAICHFIPVNKKKIVIRSQKGYSLGGNVKYIVKEILNQGLDYELVWFCSPEFDCGKEDFDTKKIRFVNANCKYKTLFETASAKLWLDDSVKIPEYRLGLRKKKNQFYINTWHGSFGIKKLFYDVDEFFSSSLDYLRLHKKDFGKYCDVMLSNCAWEDDVFRRAFRFKGKIERVGHPKNDIFFQDREIYRKKVFNKLGLSLDKKIAFYMPSFRNSLTTKCYGLDYNRAQEAFKKRFGGDWVIVTRYHSFNLQNKETIFNDKNKHIDATYYPDSQELLMAADVLISDYSSCMFDFMMTKRPCFIFATDIENYNYERGFYYPLSDTPFPIAQNNDEMCENILKFDMDKFQLDSKEFLKPKDILEDGLASKRSVQIIKDVMKIGDR